MKIAYIRTDFAHKLKAGGSVAHIKGVATAMKNLGHTVDFISTGYLTGYPSEETAVISPGILRYAIFGVGNTLYNYLSFPAFCRLMKKFKPGLMYHRYSILSNVAVRLAKRYKLPIILEYNSSEVWIAKNWHIPLYSMKAAERNELYCIHNATALVVVSQPLKTELVERGVNPEKILVNPNGADLSEYNAAILTEKEKAVFKKRLGIKPEQTVIGFIGTFGQWHGAPDIVEAAHIMQEKGQLNDNIRFLLVGDGITMPQVKEGIAKYGLKKWFILPGLIGQQEAPRYLSLFDVALNPTVPNEDGSEFFGSPTKLFEYMAMGLAIISSYLGQMKEIFDDGIDGMFYEPGNKAELAAVINKLANDEKLRAKLSAGALKKVTAKYTWEKNVERSLALIKILQP